MMCVLKKKEKVSRGHVLSQIILVAMVMYIYIGHLNFKRAIFVQRTKTAYNIPCRNGSIAAQHHFKSIIYCSQLYHFLVL